MNVLDSDERGPLHLAIEGGHTGVAENLLLRGADPEVKASGGWRPIHAVAAYDRAEIVRNLLHSGVQMNRLDGVG